MFFYSTDCNFIVKVIKTNTHYECYTKEQVMSHINQPTGTIVYKVLNNGTLERIGVVKPYKGVENVWCGIFQYERKDDAVF